MSIFLHFVLQTNLFWQSFLIVYIMTVILLILMLIMLYNILIEIRKMREILEKVG